MSNLLDLIEPHPVDETFGYHPLTPRERFACFHDRNPHVFEALESMARRVWQSGRRRIGIATLVESLRWNYWIATDDPTRDFKLNNDYRAYYARLILERHPEWEGLFALREVADTREGPDE